MLMGRENKVRLEEIKIKTLQITMKIDISILLR